MMSDLNARAVVLTLLLATTPALADACTLASQGDGRVAAIVDGRTLRLDDGRETRLSGLASLPPDHAARAVVTLSRLIGSAVTLHGDSDAPDRYGRQALLVRSAGSDHSVQADLLAQGDALADLTLAACDTLFRAAELIARRGRLGVWNDPSVIKNAESPSDHPAQAGRFSIIEGRVLSVRQAGSVTYVNFGRRWTRDFAVTISGRVLSSFAAAGLKPKSFEGKRLRIRGFMERGGPKSGPRIEAIRPEQIEIVGATDVAGASE